jgi:hypothetical protein
MSVLCRGAKVVPNSEKCKNRFDINKWCQTRYGGRISGAAAIIGISPSKEKKRRNPLA